MGLAEKILENTAKGTCLGFLIGVTYSFVGDMLRIFSIDISNKSRMIYGVGYGSIIGSTVGYFYAIATEAIDIIRKRNR